MEDSEYVRAIFADLSKAFNSISHIILLEKVKFCGIEGIALTLLTSYLVSINGFGTRWCAKGAIGSSKTLAQSLKNGRRLL